MSLIIVKCANGKYSVLQNGECIVPGNINCYTGYPLERCMRLFNVYDTSEEELWSGPQLAHLVYYMSKKAEAENKKLDIISVG